MTPHSPVTKNIYLPLLASLAFGANVPATAAPVWERESDTHHVSKIDTAVTVLNVGPKAVSEATVHYDAPLYFASSKQNAAKDELRSYGQLGANWDGFGAVAPLRDHISHAIKIIDQLPPGFAVPKPMLSADGEIGLYWDEKHAYADISIEENGLAAIFLKTKGTDKKEKFWDGLSINDLSAEWFVENLSSLRA